MENINDTFLNKLRLVKNSDRATVVFLHGDLGSGKTTFTKNLCKYLNLGFDISSPTFSILKRYDFNTEGFKNFVHIDAYRLDSYSDLKKIKFEEYLENKDNLIFIEWPSVISDGRIHPDMNINFSHSDFIDDRIVKIQ